MLYMNFKFLHLLGIFLLFSGLGGMVFMSYLEETAPKPKPSSKLPRILHGIGMLFVLVGGVMMVYSLGLDGANGVPLWVKLKMFIFLSFGPLILLARNKEKRRFLLPIAIALGCVASYLAIYKPF